MDEEKLIIAEAQRLTKEANKLLRRAKQLMKKDDEGTITREEKRELNQWMNKGSNEIMLKLFEQSQKLRDGS